MMTTTEALQDMLDEALVEQLDVVAAIQETQLDRSLTESQRVDILARQQRYLAGVNDRVEELRIALITEAE